MKISEHIENTIERWRTKWGEILGKFLATILWSGTSKVLDQIEDETRDEATPLLDMLKQIPNLPPEFITPIDRAHGKHMPQAVVAIIPYLIGIMIGLAMGMARPVANWGSYLLDKVIHSFRLDPLAVITAWRRDKPKYEHLFEDLRDQGWTDERIEALKFFTLVWPSRQDLLRYVAKEALEPEAISKYGLMDEFDRLDLTLFDQIGVSRETARLDWIAHWEHASWMQVVEMLHRGLITEEEVWEWFRLVEIPPFWRQLLIDSAYTWPTRVDVRRWWDMRTIDETELRRLYSGMGYRGVNLDNYVLWTKVYVAFPDLIARWKNGWITKDDVTSELTGLGMPAARVEEFLETKIKAAQPERTAAERDLTKTDIIKGVKKEVITARDGIELLMDLGYDEDEADYILAINIAVAAGSPESFAEFKELTQKYRIASGREAKPMPEELKKAAAELARVTDEVANLVSAVAAEEKKLIEEEVLPEEATAKRDELRVTLHRAEAALAAAQTNYDSLLAEWRHKG